MKPGDSLVQKIFEEGIRQADYVIIVLSSISLTKPWVREELDSAVVRRIEGKCRIIPVALDDCEIPVCLSHLIRVMIKDVKNYSNEVQRIINTIHGVSDRPPLGPPPSHVPIPVLKYPC